jgi:hypothetical protein
MGPLAKNRPQVCYALKSVYSSLAAEMAGMSAKAHNDISEAALAEVLAASGVAVSAGDVGPVARALARIERATALLQPPSFDDTNERFYRLLEDDGTGAAA